MRIRVADFIHKTSPQIVFHWWRANETFYGWCKVWVFLISLDELQNANVRERN